jgi:hypothetical protein
MTWKQFLMFNWIISIVKKTTKGTFLICVSSMRQPIKTHRVSRDTKKSQKSSVSAIFV